LRGKTKVLIVDDEKLLCEAMTDILEFKGYEIDSVNSGYDAIARVKDKFFDVILMDIKMPEMNGVEAFNKIKIISPKTVVILMTAYSLEDLINDALRNGVFGCMNKPIDIDEVVEQIELATGGILILLTDDDAGTREIFKDRLEAEGYKVSAASTGEEAIKIAKKNFQNILFLDMKLPARNGLEVYLSIKEINPHIVVVIITANEEDMKEWINKDFEDNLYACLTKPLDIDKCLKLIEEIPKN
jgi:DNA-binding NtrC family response regulator